MDAGIVSALSLSSLFSLPEQLQKPRIPILPFRRPPLTYAHWAGVSRGRKVYTLNDTRRRLRLKRLSLPFQLTP